MSAPYIQQLPVFVSKFTSADFTPAEWAEIQRPSVEAAERANAAADRADETKAQYDQVTSMLYAPPITLPNVIFLSEGGDTMIDQRLSEILDTYGFKGAFGLIGQTLESANAEYVGYYRSLLKNGHVILSQGYAGTDLTKMTATQLIQDITATRTLFKRLGINITGLIYPDGAYNEIVNNQVKKVFNFGVTRVEECAKNRIFVIGSFNCFTDTLDAIKQYIDNVIANNGILVLRGIAHMTDIEIIEICEYLKGKIALLQCQSSNLNDAYFNIGTRFYVNN